MEYITNKWGSSLTQSVPKSPQKYSTKQFWNGRKPTQISWYPDKQTDSTTTYENLDEQWYY